MINHWRFIPILYIYIFKYCFLIENVEFYKFLAYILGVYMVRAENLVVKELSQSIIEDFTYYVQKEVRKGRNEYLQTGIDNDLMIYREFFLNILGISLGLVDSYPNKDKIPKEELIALIKRDLSYRKYKKLVKTNRVIIYKTCALIFDKVVEGILRGELLETK